MSNALQVCAARCGQSLKRLDLSWCTKLPRAIFLQAIPSFACLKSLDLSHNKFVGDSHLAVVGVYAKCLEELNLNFTVVSDAGLLCLFLPQDEKGKEDSRYGVCERIAILKVEHTNVDEVGASRALLSLPRMAHLGYHDSVGAVYSALQERPDRVFSISSLSSTSAEITDDVLHACLQACPKISRLYLSTYSTMTPDSLLPLATGAKELSEIHLTNSDGSCFFQMELCLLPVLMGHGETLLSVNLTEVAGVCATQLLSLCPNLQHLSLNHNVQYVSSVDIGRKSNKLRTLTILCHRPDGVDNDGVGVSPSADDLLSLLFAPGLQKLALSNCQGFNDAVVEETARRCSRFTELCSLELDGCDNVSMELLNGILLSRNPLKKVRLTNCQDIHRKDVDAYKRRLVSMSLDKEVSVEWL